MAQKRVKVWIIVHGSGPGHQCPSGAPTTVGSPWKGHARPSRVPSEPSEPRKEKVGNERRYEAPTGILRHLGTPIKVQEVKSRRSRISKKMAKNQEKVWILIG